MNKPDDTPTPEPPHPVRIAPSLAREPFLVGFAAAAKADQLKGSLTPDRWNWLYVEPSGGYSVLPDRSETKAAVGRVYCEGSIIVAWEPAG